MATILLRNVLTILSLCVLSACGGGSPTQATNAGASSPAPAEPTSNALNIEQPPALPAPLIAASDMTAITSSCVDAATCATVLEAMFETYKPIVRARLSWPTALDDDGLRLVFATAVTYQSALYPALMGSGNGAGDGYSDPCGGSTNPCANPLLDPLWTNLKYNYLECVGDALVISRIFTSIKTTSNWSVHIIGFDGNPAFGDHAQVLAINPSLGMGLVLDADGGLVALVGAGPLPSTTPVTNIAIVGERYVPGTQTLDATEYETRTDVLQALEFNQYDTAQQLYDIDTSVWYNVGTQNVALAVDYGRVEATLFVLPSNGLTGDRASGNWATFSTLFNTGFPTPPDDSELPANWFAAHVWEFSDMQGNEECISTSAIWSLASGPSCPS